MWRRWGGGRDIFSRNMRPAWNPVHGAFSDLLQTELCASPCDRGPRLSPNATVHHPRFQRWRSFTEAAACWAARSRLRQRASTRPPADGDVRARCRRYLTRMANRFDIVAVGIEHECAVVVGMIMRADARRAVVAATCPERGFVEGIDCRAVLRLNCNMHRLFHSAFSAHPTMW